MAPPPGPLLVDNSLHSTPARTASGRSDGWRWVIGAWGALDAGSVDRERRPPPGASRHDGEPGRAVGSQKSNDRPAPPATAKGQRRLPHQAFHVSIAACRQTPLTSLISPPSAPTLSEITTAGRPFSFSGKDRSLMRLASGSRLRFRRPPAFRLVSSPNSAACPLAYVVPGRIHFWLAAR